MILSYKFLYLWFKLILRIEGRFHSYHRINSGVRAVNRHIFLLFWVSYSLCHTTSVVGQFTILNVGCFMLDIEFWMCFILSVLEYLFTLERWLGLA